MGADLNAYLRAQRMTKADLDCNRAGKPSPAQLARELRGSTTGLVVLGVLMVVLGVGLPLGFTLAAPHVHGMQGVLWGTSLGIAGIAILPIMIWQLFVRRNLTSKPLVVVEGAVESVGLVRGAVALRLGGRQFFMRVAAADRVLVLVEPRQRLRLYTVARSMGVLAIEPIELPARH
jgi:hypothetical protein